MVRLAISVEGLTEEKFIKQLIQPYLAKQNIDVKAINSHGSLTIAKVRKELNRLAYGFDYVSTLYDFYGFKGKKIGETKAGLEQRIVASVSETQREKIIPYVQMYEFEGLLFSSPEAIESSIGQRGLSKWAANILHQFSDNPEAINNSEATAPSKRLINEVNMYLKTTHGPNIAKEIGVDGLRASCTGFDNWLLLLEALEMRLNEDV
ncbi:MAG: DUF4276 family protein [Mariprofundaceae bacterium]|nr:DUF4276 family protein [Mariprofundaceae bacterium]